MQSVLSRRRLSALESLLAVSGTPPSTGTGSAWMDSGGGVCGALTPAFDPIAGCKVASYVPNGTKLRCLITAGIGNNDGVPHNVILGVAAVAAGGPAPVASDYANGAVILVFSGEVRPMSLVVQYGAGGSAPPAVVKGVPLDLYAMISANDNVHITYAAHAVQFEIDG